MFTFISFLLTISILFIHVEIYSNADISRLQLSISPQFDVSNYDIALWTSQLNLQSCAIVEIGICECSVMTNWQFCSPMLTNIRRNECTFYYNDTSSRVHRRLCDISAISEWGNACNCSKLFESVRLKSVKGFPTCIKPPLPESICRSKNPCGTASCKTKTVKGGIHKMQCSKHCHKKQPFCENKISETSMPPETKSRWTAWEISNSNEYQSYVTETAVCIDLVTKMPSLDCLGPGTKCCTKALGNCICAISNQLGYLVLTRTSTKEIIEN